MARNHHGVVIHQMGWRESETGSSFRHDRACKKRLNTERCFDLKDANEQSMRERGNGKVDVSTGVNGRQQSAVEHGLKKKKD